MISIRLLFVWPITHISVWDVASGYRRAFGRLFNEGCIRDFRLDQSAEYHTKATLVGTEPGKVVSQQDKDALMLRASQSIVNDAIYHRADLVFMVAAFGIHPAVLWSLRQLRQIGVHTAVLLTESPYDDVNQADWVSVYPEMSVFTNERTSAAKYGWKYLPHAYDPDVHKPVRPLDADVCDISMVATGWPNRQRMLEAVDWSGIDLRLYGYWPTIDGGNSLQRCVVGGIVPNNTVAGLYAGSRISLNIHREASGADSLNPRVYEAAACGTFQLSDSRPELEEVFGDSIPTFSSAMQLSDLVLCYLRDEVSRRRLARLAAERVRDCTFDNRALGLLNGMIS